MRAALDASIAGMTSALVLRGDAGAGKTALLTAFMEQAPSSTRILRIEGVESEAEIGFAGLHRLLRPLLQGASTLPVPQRDALGTALGLATGPRPDRLHVGLATLTLLTDVATDGPVACVVDDAQWIDEESMNALGFVARRLHADRVAMIFAVRGPTDIPALQGFEELIVDGLDHEDAVTLLDELFHGHLDETVVSRITAESNANPLLLHELARTYGADELNRLGVQPHPMLFGRSIERAFTERVAALPDETSTLMLLLAADQRADLVLLRSAASSLGIHIDALDPARTAGLVDVIGDRIAFSHPLARSSCYGAADSAARRQAHATLAGLFDAEQDLERHAWHVGLATAEADARVAAILVSAARSARPRGATRSQVELLSLAAELTPDPVERGRRHLHACNAAFAIADLGQVDRLVARARASTSDPQLLSEIDHVEALAPVFRRRYADAPRALLSVAEQARDRTTARAVALEALFMLGLARADARDVTERDLATAIRRMSRDPASPTTLIDLLLDGYAAVVLDGWAVGADTLRDAFTRWPAEANRLADVQRFHGPPLWAAFTLWDYDAAEAIIESNETIARSAGAWDPLRSTLVYVARLRAAQGRFGDALAAASEAVDLSAMMHNDDYCWPLCVTKSVSSQGGDEARSLIDDLRRVADVQQLGTARDLANLSAAILANGEGRYADAAAATLHITESAISQYGSQALAEQAEAFARLDRRVEFEATLREIEGRAAASGTDTARGVAARSAALGLGGQDADDRYREAIERLSRTSAALDLGRAQLLYGEWLRRERHQIDAAPTAARRVRAALADGRIGLRRTCAARARGDGRACAEARSGAHRTDAPGASGRAPGTCRRDQPGDRHPLVHQRGDGRLPPAQGVPEARHRVPPAAHTGRARLRRTSSLCTAGRAAVRASAVERRKPRRRTEVMCGVIERDPRLVDERFAFVTGRLHRRTPTR